MLFFPLRRKAALARRRPMNRVLGVEALEQRLALTIALDVFDNTSLGTAGAVYVTGHGIPGAPGAPLDDLRVLGNHGAFVQGAVKVSTAMTTGTTARITTPVPHQVQAGQLAFMSGVSVAGYNGVFTVTAVEAGATPTWFEYTVSSALGNGAGGAVYLQTLISSQTITAAKAVGGASKLITVTLSGDADLPLNSPIVISGLTGAGTGWNGEWAVSQNSSSNAAIKRNQFQFNFSSATTGTATLSSAKVEIASLAPVAVSSLPINQATQRPSVTLNDQIATYSSQLVLMVTPTGQTPFPLGLTPGTINISNLGIPPFAVGQQAGNSVVDIVEFFYAGAGNSTFDVSAVDGVSLPLTLNASTVTSGPSQVGINPALTGISREAIGQAYTAFINNEPVAVKNTGKFGRLLYTGATSGNVLPVALASQPGTPLTGVSLAFADTLVTATTTGPHGLVPGQAIAISGAGAPYDGSFTVLTTGLINGSLAANEFTYIVASVPAVPAPGATVTPTDSGVIAATSETIVVEITSGTAPVAGDVVELTGVSTAEFNNIYTVQAIPPAAGLPATAVLLATRTGQSFSMGASSGGGDLATPVFVAPPSVPDNQFYVIAAPKDWLANQPVSTANDDPMVTWWDTTIDDFFKANNFLQVAIGTSTSFTGTYNTVTSAFDFRPGLATTGGVSFSLDKPTPQNVFGGEFTTQSQSLANATWVWAQAGIPANALGTVWDQIVQSFVRGVALEGVLTAAPTSTGQSNAAWTDVSKWYTDVGAYGPFSKFAHYSTLTGATDRTGATSIYVNNQAYGFAEDETPIGADGVAISTDVPSKLDGTVPDNSTLTVTVNPWTGTIPSAPTVVSVDTNPPQVGTKPTPTSAATVTWSVTFSEPVKGVTAANFGLVAGGSLVGTSITTVTPNGVGQFSKTWTVTAGTGTGTGTLGLNITTPTGIVDQSDDALSLPGGKFIGQVYSVRPNPVGPTATITRTGANPTSATTVPFAVMFTEAVTGLTAANFTLVAAGGVTGAFVQSVSGSGTSWTVTVNTGTGSGTLALQMTTSAGVTPAVIGLPVTSLAYTIDKNIPVDPPTVKAIARINPSPTSAASVSWYVMFSEPVTGVTSANFSLVVGAGLGGTPVITGVTPVNSSNTSLWTITASTGTGTGTLGLNMTNSTGVHDAEMQPVSDLPFVGAPYAIDRTAPAVLSIVRAGPNPTVQTAVSWTVSFSKVVGNVSEQNFQLVSTGVSGAQITQVVETPGTGGMAWTVTALTGSGNGTIRLDMVNATGITDAVDLSPTGIPLVGQTYQVQRGSATIVAVPIAFMTTAGVASRLIWMMPAFTDADSVQLTATLAVSPGAGGTLQALSRAGVTVTPSGGSVSELQFSGTQAALNAYFSRRAGFITYTPALGQPLTPRILTLAAQGSDGLSGLTTAALLVRAATPQNPPPRIRGSAVIAGRVRQPVVITYDQLVAATGATQTRNRSIQFMLGGVTSGNLQVWTGSRWAAVPRFANLPLLAPGGRIRWIPPANAVGLRAAFTVRTWDGWQLSSVSQVRVNLTP